MIDTKHLRDLIRRAVPLPWALATSNSYRRIVRADRYEEVCSPVTMPDGHPDLWFPDGPQGANARLLIEAANALPGLLDDYDRMREAAKQFHNLTIADPSVTIRAQSKAQRDAISDAGEQLRAALAQEGS